MEGPYRDLGSGFARLSGAEAPRRAPSSIASVEDALLELLRNARDAGASNIHVASTLSGRRYRSLTVIDDGCGVPEGYANLIFEPGVTTRHLGPTGDSASPHGAGLALHHVRNSAVEAKLANPGSPTSVRAVFDTRAVPERSLQSETRTSKSNLLATTASFAKEHPTLTLFHAAPAPILASLIKSHIIQVGDRKGIASLAERLGLEVSSKTVWRVLRGDVGAAERIVGSRRERGRGPVSGVASGFRDGRGGLSSRNFHIGEDVRMEVADILGRAARASYLEVVDVKFHSRPGEVSITARVHEPEDEYE